MANKLKYDTPLTYDAALGSGLNSLASGSAATSSNIGNSSDKCPLMDISGILGAFNPSGTPYLEIHLLPLLDDGSSYADRGVGTLVASVQVSTGSSAKKFEVVGIPIPPGDFEIAVVNQTGTTFASSGNTVKTRRYGFDNNA